MTAQKKLPLSSSYLNLIRKFPLRPIANHNEYEIAVDLMKKLAVRGEEELDRGEQDYLNALDEFISLYDHRHFSLLDKRSPLDRLKYILQESSSSPAELKKILGCSQSLVSMVLGGVRELSKANIRALSDHFKVEPGLFF